MSRAKGAIAILQAVTDDRYDLYRCVAAVLLGEESRFREILVPASEHILEHWQDFAPAVMFTHNVSSGQAYVDKMTVSGGGAGQAEVQAICDVFKARIEVHNTDASGVITATFIIQPTHGVYHNDFMLAYNQYKQHFDICQVLPLSFTLPSTTKPMSK